MIETALQDALKPLGISVNDFSELLIRLLDYGVISRHESQIEGALYDRYLQCAAVLEEYLVPLRVRIQHDRQFCFVRLFPPGAIVPSLPDEEHQAFAGGFRVKPGQQEVAVILALRVEYEKALREAKVDERGCALLSLEGLAIALNNLLKRSLPDSSVERAQIFKRLRQLRLIHYNQEQDLDAAESWIRIQPDITSFVSDDVLAELYPQNKENKEGNKGDRHVL